MTDTQTKLESTKRVSEADYARCVECGQTWDALQPFWSMSKSLTLHKNGTGHKKVELFRLAGEN